MSERIEHVIRHLMAVAVVGGLGCSDTATVGREVFDGGADDGGWLGHTGDASVSGPALDAAASPPNSLDVTLSAQREDVSVEPACDSACFEVQAQVSGGQAPYVFEWSDPLLVGAGPHHVCVQADAELSVRVTDSSHVQAEFVSEPRVGEASAHLSLSSDECPQEESCDCDYGQDLLPQTFNNSPVPGTTFFVCAGSPSIHQAWEILPDLTAVDGTHYVHLKAGDVIDIPLSRAIEPGERFWVSHTGGALFGEGSAEPCGEVVAAGDVITGAACPTRVKGPEPVRYLRVKVHPVVATSANIARLDAFFGCEPRVSP